MAQWTSSNWTNADEYDCSGTPYVTGSHGTADLTQVVQKFSFPRVTRWIQVWNHNTATANTMKIGFTANGILGTLGHMSGTTASEASAHYILLPGDASGLGNNTTGRLELRCKEVHIVAGTATKVNFTLLAGLTNIPPRNFPTLTGSIGGVEQIYGVG